ncbi:MAG: hypothetical protein A2086_01635 [Spirochaetes bacterium GWD1_27_9]|nr:MAG: hypothetical protein A2Y34_17575 [Spirochaetes bacterium GWC1_27_15]OHD41804.1 MAG: hypothetical protein A2086_01635 [Spirochaetes bacterium GWD1_27_9]
MYDNYLSENELVKLYDNYIENINSISGISEYRKIKNYLHDSIINKISINKDILFNLTLYDETKNISFTKKMIFQNGRIISYNKVLKSGNIKRINKSLKAYEYLYDEFYKIENSNYVTIIFTNKNKTKTGFYFPMVTIKFDTIRVID